MRDTNHRSQSTGARIRLYDAGIGLIFPSPSGVTYSNQTGGTFCQQPEIEGVYLPYDAEEVWLRLFDYFSGPKHKGAGAIHGLDIEDADFMDQAIAPLESGRVKVDRSCLGRSHEAWVYVIVDNETQTSKFEGFGPYPRTAILTWPNSD